MSEEALHKEIRNVAARAAELLRASGRDRPARPEPEYTAVHAVAALLSRFRTADLTALGATPDDVDDVLGDSTPVADPASRGYWTMVPSIRADVLRRLGHDDRLHDAIADLTSKIPAAHDDPLCRSITSLSRYGSSALAGMSASDLALVAPLLESVGRAIPRFPDRQEVEARLAQIRLFEPFEHLVGTHFRGRVEELKKLRVYVDVLDAESALEALGRVFSSEKKLPFLVYGVGGVGKSTLVAKFILDHAKTNEYRFPFAYLDYDRSAVLVDEPASLLIEAVRQIGLQYREAQNAAISLRQSWRSLLAQAAPAKAASHDPSALNEAVLVARRRIRDDFVSFIGRLGIDRKMPVLLVLDTFEEMQWRNRAYVDSLQVFLSDLRESIPRLRVVLVGRAKVPELATEESMKLEEFDAEAAAGFLESAGITDPAVAAAIVKRVTGNPLSLRLAAAVFQLEKMTIEAFTALGKEITQGQLFARILEHVHSTDVQKIAHPGLVLRRVTADLIREVLAGPCDLVVPDTAAADALFAELEREVALVSPAESNVVVHRADVRKLMLGPLRDSKPEQVKAIHEGAVTYYSRFSDPVSRAEELYHRLSLGQTSEEVESRFMPGLAPYLTSALDELNPAEAAWLADRLGVEIPPEARAAASQEVWERAVERRLDEYLRQRHYESALQLLGERTERSARTMVRVREAMLLCAMKKLEEANAVVVDAISAYGVAGNSRALFETYMVGADVSRLGRAFSEARERLAHAERIAIDENDFLRRVRVLVEQCIVCEAEGLEPGDETVKTLCEVAAEIPDAAWSRDPALLRLAAVFGGVRDEILLEKALRLAPPPRLTPDRQRSFEELVGTPSTDPGPPTVDFILSALTSETSPSGVKSRVIEWLRSETRLGAAAGGDAVPKARRKRMVVKREDVGPLVVGLHLTKTEVDQILEHRFQRSLESVAFSEHDETIVREILDAAESGGWLPEFLDAVRLVRREPALLTALDRMGIGVSVSDAGSLRQDVIADLLETNRSLVAMFEHSICRIEESSKLRGTGFLVGEDRIITAQPSVVPIASLQVRFDYGEIAGTVFNHGSTARVVSAGVPAVAGSRLLFLILDRAIGRELVGGSQSVHSAFRRTALDLDHAWRIEAGARMLWMWHSPAKLEIAGATVESVSDDAIVLDTRGRSEHAGAPCFDQAFGLVGIHCGPHPEKRGRALVMPFARAASPGVSA